MSKDLYPDARLDTTDRAILREEFVDFGDMWNTTTHLIKNSWKPFLWKSVLAKFLLIIAGFIGAGILLAPIAQGFVENIEFGYDGTTYSLTEFAEFFESIEGDEPIDSNEITLNTDQVEKFLDQNGSQALIAIGVTSIVAAGIGLIMALLNIRIVKLFMNKEEEGLLKFDKSTWLALLKIVVVMFVFGILAGIARGVFEAVTNSSFVLTFLNQLINFIFYSFFGLFSFFIILDKTGVVQSIKQSFQSMNDVYWKNVLRWLMYQFVYFAAFIVLMVVCFLLLIVLSVVITTSSALLSFVFITGPVFLIYFVGSLLLETFYLSFNTVSYYNILHITDVE